MKLIVDWNAPAVTVVVEPLAAASAFRKATKGMVLVPSTRVTGVVCAPQVTVWLALSFRPIPAPDAVPEVKAATKYH